MTTLGRQGQLQQEWIHKKDMQNTDEDVSVDRVDGLCWPTTSVMQRRRQEYGCLRSHPLRHPTKCTPDG